jgi:hypothetical protein
MRTRALMTEMARNNAIQRADRGVLRVSQYVSQRRIPSKKLGTARLFQRAAINEWIAERAARAPAALKQKAEASAAFTAAQRRDTVSPMKGMTLTEARKWNRTHDYKVTPGHQGDSETYDF